MKGAKGNFELQCKSCGERNPRQFDFCWSCKESLEHADRVASVDETSDDDSMRIPTAPNVAANRATDWLELSAVILITWGPSILNLFLNVPASSSSDIHAQLIWIPMYAGTAVLLWILIRRDRLALQPVALRQCHWLSELGIAAAVFLSSGVINVLVLASAGFFGLPNGSAPPDQPITGAGPIVGLVVCYFFAALYEEVLFLVYLQAKFQSLVPGKVALSILISAGLFAIGHGYPLPETLAIFASNVFRGSVYQFTRRVPSLVLAHWLHNIWATWL